MDKTYQIEEYAKTFEEAEYAHGFDHVNRVRNWVVKICKAEGYPNIDMAQAAALLHDIGLKKAAMEKKRSKHGIYGAELAREFLSNNKLFSPSEIDEICNAIRFHNTNREGEGELLNILMDADILDLLGYIGICRGYMSHADRLMYDPEHIKGETWQMAVKKFNERFDKGLGTGKTLPDQINFQASCIGNLSTGYAKRMAKKRVKAMHDFLINFEKEVLENERN